MLSLVRIDDRLIHGQVVEGWIPYLKAQVVVVASDAAAADETQVALMRMAVPDDIELDVLPVKDVAAFLGGAGLANKKILVLAPGPREVLDLVEAGVPLPRVNVGGLHYSAGRVQLGKAIFLSEEDVAALRRLCQLGVRIEGRALPNEKEIDLLGLIEARA